MCNLFNVGLHLIHNLFHHSWHNKVNFLDNFVYFPLILRLKQAFVQARDYCLDFNKEYFKFPVINILIQLEKFFH